MKVSRLLRLLAKREFEKFDWVGWECHPWVQSSNPLRSKKWVDNGGLIVVDGTRVIYITVDEEEFHYELVPVEPKHRQTPTKAQLAAAAKSREED
jgi:hypothetical protein